MTLRGGSDYAYLVNCQPVLKDFSEKIPHDWKPMYGAFFRVAENQFHFETHFCIPSYPSCANIPYAVQKSFYDILYKVRTDFIK
jgi:hypothetical protein